MSFPQYACPCPSNAPRFTASPRSKKRAINLLAENRQQAQPSPKKRKIPALKLTSLAPLVQVDKVTDAQTSPIEDPSDPFPTSTTVPLASDSGNKAALQAGPSRLYLEVKERVARHSSMKPRDKVVKLNNKYIRGATVRPSGPSIIDISSSPPPSNRTSSPAPLPSTTIKSTSKNTRVAREDKPKPKPTKGKKRKPPPMTPVEYAIKLREKMTPRGVSRKKSGSKFLEGMNIVYTGGDMQFASEQTRGRMDLVCSSAISS